ncbi:sulfurtransferase [Niastella vici]|uniref:Sulfurtransferase n=1 Tax=Niastella vici TaxID=1703345 RepID=A0A1V9FUD6_9BACT|nr:sulfurtransferase [Niastella vici]OQP61917.1 sulfurtransferase [Niastella vici]
MLPLCEIKDTDLNKPGIVIIDARGGKDSWQRYMAGHLKNAIYADLDKHLAASVTDAAVGGRHPLPEIKDFATLLGTWGITPDSHVIVYDDKSAANSAARLWWMLQAIGHEKVQVINGGLQAAIHASVPLSTDVYTPVPAVPYPVTLTYKGTADITETAAAAQDDHRLVIDVRETARYLGQTEPIDLIAGHIPGAVNLPYVKNLDADGNYLPAEALRKAYEEVLTNVEPENVIVHCGSGVTACHTLLGMAHAGIIGPKLYVGSWSEWSRRGLPIATDKR